MKAYHKLLEENAKWASEIAQETPDYFEKLAQSQSPDFLWIGCADSRVPADRITGTQPGEIFVHRNVANLVVHTDTNFLSVLQYAVEVLKVKHILVVGHYQCGGVKAAMGNQDLGLINNWLRHIKDVLKANETELDAIESFDKRFDRAVELNVMQQVKNVVETSFVQRAWQKGEYPHVHGWVMDLGTGLIKTVVDIDSTKAIDSIYRYDY